MRAHGFSRPRRQARLAWLLAVLLLLPETGCQKLRSVFAPRPATEVEQHSYPIPVYAYQTSLQVKTAPRELTAYFIEDVSWVTKASGLLQLELISTRPGISLTQVGEAFDFKIKILTFSFTCRVVPLLWKQDRELWLLISTSGSWLLLRYELKPNPEGTLLQLRAVGQPSKSLTAVLESFSLTEAIAARVEQMLAYVQAYFDPALEAPSAPRGRRGELYSTFLQGDASSIGVEAPPERVVQWVFSQPENLNILVPNLRFQGVCFENPGLLLAHPEELTICPSLYQMGGMEINALVLTQGGWEDPDRRSSYRQQLWIVALHNLVNAQIQVDAKDRGSEIQVVLATELADSEGPEALDFLIAVAGVPSRVKQALLRIKAEIEAPAP